MANPLEQMQDHLSVVVANYCPPHLRNEAFSIRLAAAFMEVTALASDQHRFIKGKNPIRPLTSYPDPLVGFRTETEKMEDKVLAEQLKESDDEIVDIQSQGSRSYDNLSYCLKKRGATPDKASRAARYVIGGFQKAFDIGTIAANRMFRSQHIEWMLDCVEDEMDINSQDQWERLVLSYVNKYNNRRSLMLVATGEKS
jgi:hypothetical protein